MRADHRNHLSGEERTKYARMGRGEDAFTPKEARWWIKAQKRIQVIVEREAQRVPPMKVGYREALHPHLRLRVGELGTVVEVL